MLFLIKKLFYLSLIITLVTQNKLFNLSIIIYCKLFNENKILYFIIKTCVILHRPNCCKQWMGNIYICTMVDPIMNG
jgi:hypothetical protein